MARATARPPPSSTPGDPARERTGVHHDPAATSWEVYDLVRPHTDPAHGASCTDADVPVGPGGGRQPHHGVGGDLAVGHLRAGIETTDRGAGTARRVVAGRPGTRGRNDTP